MERDSSDLDAIIRLIGMQGIHSFFQPIVELSTGEVFGYEILSRGNPPLESPTVMFDVAERYGVSWDLEYACRREALRTIASLDTSMRRRRFFLNVSPPTFNDARFRDGFTLKTIDAAGLDQGQIILEITETTSVRDYAAFESIVRHYVEQGFRVALDDFGSGHSGLLTLIALTPHFIKLDRELVMGIDGSAYKQSLVRSLVAFASTVESQIIGEGVETAAEMEMLFRLGVRFGQGYFLAPPASAPPALRPEAAALIDRLARANRSFGFPLDSLVRGILRPPRVCPWNEVRCKELDNAFRRSPELDHVVLLSDGKPPGMLTRTRFYNLMGGPYGYSLYSNRLVDEMAKTDILIVPEDVDIRLLGRRAMQRGPEDLYDPVLVAGPNGGIKGTLTMKEVLTQAIEYEVRVASCSNPLTGLPGNMMIQGWLRDAFAHAPFAIAYVDLVHFKEYNDTYGFSKGDEMIGLCARLLVEAFAGARIGHLGGDDFVVVFDGDVSRSSLARLCEKFDAAKLSLFTSEDTARGWYEAIDRTGKRARVAPVTLSVAVITSDKLPADIHAGRLSRIIAGLKTQAKAQNLRRGRSGYLFERRTHKPEAAITDRASAHLAGDLPA